MVDYLSTAETALTALQIARAAPRLLLAYFGQDSQALAELMRTGDAAWVTDVCERLRETQETLEERLHQVHPLVTSLRWEAARDATQERRLMLACVAAYLLNSSEKVETKARVERTIRDLDPEDTGLLAFLCGLRAAPAFSAWERHPRRSNLGTCVEVDYRPLAGLGGRGKPTLNLSETGRLVLNALRGFHDETLLAGFEQTPPRVPLADLLTQQHPAVPFWVTHRSTHPLRVLTIGGGPSIAGEIFSWDRERQAYVLTAATEHILLPSEEWILLQPKANQSFLRQDNETSGRPLIVCDPLAAPTKAELEFVHLPER